jgi:hypothetical protein
MDGPVPQAVGRLMQYEAMKSSNANGREPSGSAGPGALRTAALAWSVVRQCREQGVACFVKQLGRRPVSGQKPLKLRSCKGKDWEEWSADLRRHQYLGL